MRGTRFLDAVSQVFSQPRGPEQAIDGVEVSPNLYDVLRRLGNRNRLPEQAVQDLDSDIFVLLSESACPGNEDRTVHCSLAPAGSSLAPEQESANLGHGVQRGHSNLRAPQSPASFQLPDGAGRDRQQLSDLAGAQ